VENLVFMFVRTKIGTAIACATRKKGIHFFLRKKNRRVGESGRGPRYTGFDLCATKEGPDLSHTEAIMFFLHIDALPLAEKPRIGLFGRGSSGEIWLNILQTWSLF